MPNKHFYFALGAMHGTAIIVVIRMSRHWLYGRARWLRRLYRFDRDWFLYFPFVIGLFGLIGLIPDILHATGILSKETTRSPLFDIFFFHSTFERLEDSNKLLDWWLNSIGSITLFLLSIGILLFYVRLIKKIKNNNA